MLTGTVLITFISHGRAYLPEIETNGTNVLVQVDVAVGDVLGVVNQGVDPRALVGGVVYDNNF